MAVVNKLAKDTFVYGLSSIVGKFLNWLLVPLYTFVLHQQSDYGIVTNLYAWTALLLVILTYGMETGFFRFATDDKYKVNAVYGTALTSLFVTSSLFIFLCVFAKDQVAALLKYPDHPDFIMLLGVVVAMDAFASIPFAYLRYKNKALTFAILKLVFVFLNIFFNIFFLIVCPKMAHLPFISFWYDAQYGVGYVFVANILATFLQTLCLLPYIFAEKYSFSFSLLRQMLKYSLPLLILGVSGIMNQTLDRIIFKYLHPAILTSDPILLSQDYTKQVDSELGIYGACFKVAMVMMVFTQAFRYAYEPFVFAKHKDKNSLSYYADAMKYYIIFSYIILLGIVFFLDVLKFIIAPAYWEGLVIIPIVLWTYIFQGVYFNLSFWYKLTDKTYWGALFSILGLAINLIFQLVFVHYYGYVASACGSLVCFFILMVVSYFVGKQYLKVPYDLHRMGWYTLIVVITLFIFYLFGTIFDINILGKLGLGCVLLVIFCYLCVKKDIYVLWNSRRYGSSGQN